VLLSFAISPGWAQPLTVIALFAVLDLVTANVVEPLIFGHSTGVSPVALLVAAAFWTWIWGPIGLVLSTPLTVCMVVLGQHVPRLKFLSLLLGDQPALAPHVAYYQRLLAGDQEEAAAVARQYAAGAGVEQLPDKVLIPALLMARRDRKHAGLTAETESLIFDATREILQRLRAERLEVDAPASDQPAEAAVPTSLVLACPSHHPAEELTLHMLADAAQPLGAKVEVVSTRTLPVEIETKIALEAPALVFLAVLPPGGVVQASYLCRRLRKKFPDLKIVVGYWGRVRDFDRLLVRLRSAGASYVTTSIAQTISQLRALLGDAIAAPAAPRPLQADAPASEQAPVPTAGAQFA
jgi:hypothetical protein